MGIPSVEPAVVTSLRGRAEALAHERTLPVLDPLTELVPGGALVRGQVVEVSGVAEVSLALALAAQASRTGSWLAVVEHAGVFELGAGAAAELGVVLERTVVIALPTGDITRSAEVVATLIDGFDVVVLPVGASWPAALARRLQARLRTRGGVIVVVGGRGCWESDLVLRSTPADRQGGWEPLDEVGRLHRRRILVEVDARRRGVPRRHVMWLPDHRGSVTRVG